MAEYMRTVGAREYAELQAKLAAETADQASDDQANDDPGETVTEGA